MAHRCIVMGAAGRDFHNFLTFFRMHPEFRVVCFTAAQIPSMSDRSFPKELAGDGYTEDISIYPERELPRLISELSIDFVFLAYSDISHVDVMHLSSQVQACGASFVLLGPKHTWLRSRRPVISVTGTRTGVGKSPLSLAIARLLISRGLRVAILRHPMPYGKLLNQRVQKFDSEAALLHHNCTIEEREEYEPYIATGVTVWAGVDYAAILQEAERDADVVLWDGGNNDLSFVQPNLSIVVTDALRASHETGYYPGESNLRMADVVVINKVSSATAADVAMVRANVEKYAPQAIMILSDLDVRLEPSDAGHGRRVLVIEDGPTMTHGGMASGAGLVAAKKYHVKEIIDPRPYAVGSIAEAYQTYSHLGPVLPALGYSESQRHELAKTIANAKPDVIFDASPARIDRVLRVSVPIARVSYQWVQKSGPSLVDRCETVARHATPHASRSLQPSGAPPAHATAPRSAADFIRQVETFTPNNYKPLPVVLTKGDGCFVWDVDGRKYLDCLSGYSALNQGHCHPRIVEALRSQAQKLTLTSRAFHNDVTGDLLERLCQLTGFDKVLLMNTGVEAVETAVKAIRRWGARTRQVQDGEIIVAEGNFHGRTVTAVSMSTNATSYDDFGPLTPGFVKVPFGDVVALEKAMTPKTIGVLLEPIQGEAGVRIPADDYLPKVRALCNAKQIVMALDEVQTGLGRTGRMFAWQHTGAKPDLMIVGKALSGGVYPVSAVCGSNDLMQVFTPGSHGSTFGGNPLGSAVALAALAVIEDEHLVERAATLGEKALLRLRGGLSGDLKIKDVRGRGLMLAVEFYDPLARKMAERIATEAGALCKDAHERILRIMPPLMTPESVLMKAIDLIALTIRRTG